MAYPLKNPLGLKPLGKHLLDSGRRGQAFGAVPSRRFRFDVASDGQVFQQRIRHKRELKIAPEAGPPMQAVVKGSQILFQFSEGNLDLKSRRIILNHLFICQGAIGRKQ